MNVECGNRPRLASAALWYARHRRWCAFPLAFRDKVPLIRRRNGGRGVYDATVDLNMIYEWWQRWPMANIGLATGHNSGFFALDIDPRSGGDDSLASLLAEHGELPATVEACTGGGGRHILFRYVPGLEQVVWSPLVPGVDLKGDGGYIVAPPSIHPNGRRYCWEASSRPEELDLAEPPHWLVAALLSQTRKPRRGSPSPSQTTASPDDFLLGSAFRAAGWLGNQIAPGRWAVRCPNEAFHTTGRRFDGSTVLFAPGPGQSTGWFHCSHEHCR